MKETVEIDDVRREVDAGGDDGVIAARIGEQSLVADVCWLGAHSLSLIVDGQSFDIDLLPHGSAVCEVFVAGNSVRVGFPLAELSGWSGEKKRTAVGRVAAPMPGKVVTVLVAEGDPVTEGQGVVVVEAMKMENEMLAPLAGRVTAVHVRPGQVVDGGTPLVDIEVVERRAGESCSERSPSPTSHPGPTPPIVPA